MESVILLVLLGFCIGVVVGEAWVYSKMTKPIRGAFRNPLRGGQVAGQSEQSVMLSNVLGILHKCQTEMRVEQMRGVVYRAQLTNQGRALARKNRIIKILRKKLEMAQRPMIRLEGVTHVNVPHVNVGLTVIGDGEFVEYDDPNLDRAGNPKPLDQ